MKSQNSLTDQIFQGKIFGFSYYSSPERSFEPSIDLTLIESEITKIFRFSSPSQVEIDSRYSQHNFGLQIIDMSEGQMEYVNLLVNGHLENVGDFRFWARGVTEVTEIENQK